MNLMSECNSTLKSKTGQAAAISLPIILILGIGILNELYAADLRAVHFSDAAASITVPNGQAFLILKITKTFASLK